METSRFRVQGFRFKVQGFVSDNASSTLNPGAFNKMLQPYGHRGVFGEAARAVRAIAMPSLPVSLARI